MYVLKTYYKDVVATCLQSEECDSNYKFIVTSKDRYEAVGRNFKYNNCFSIKENMNYVMNRIHSVCYTDVSIDDFDIEDVYDSLKDLTTYDKELRLIVIPEKLISNKL